MATHPDKLPRQRATARLRIRQGAASVSAPIAGYIEAGAVFDPDMKLNGDAVLGNSTWYRLSGNRFIWSGASVAIPAAAAPPPAAAMDVNRRPNGGIAVLTGASRDRVFGTFDYREIAGGAIKIDPTWVKANIVALETPILAHAGYKKIYVHRKAKEPFARVFEKIAAAGLRDQIKACAGTWVARHMGWDPARALSSHSWGAAIDLNAAWNGYGVRPAALGSPGSVRELVPIFESEGFAWGGYFEPLKYADGMHFELARKDL